MKMTNKWFLLGMVISIMVFGITVVGCDNDSANGDSSSNGGIFILYNIPSEFNGKYAYLKARNDIIELRGVQSYNVSTDSFEGALISNNRVEIPMWIFENNDTVQRYTGNHTVELAVGIHHLAVINDEYFTVAILFGSVTFSNGNATRSSNNGTFFTQN
jgi:hypothetical protein